MTTLVGIYADRIYSYFDVVRNNAHDFDANRRGASKNKYYVNQSRKKVLY